MPGPASRLYAQNVVNLVTLMTADGDDVEPGTFAPDVEDEIVASSCVTRDGAISARADPHRDRGPGPRRCRHRGGDPPVNDAVTWLTIFVLSVFVGIEVISKVSSTLHTPLMSGANAIHGIILLGAILVTGETDNGVALAVGLVAIVLAAVNMVGGFVVTDRMLQMFVRKKPKAAATPHRRERRLMPTWVQLVYLLCAICFILALKGLSGPRTARTGNLIGAAGAVVACVVPFIYLDLDHVPLILAAIALGTVGGVIGAQRVQMTQMPQMVALFNGVGGGAAALVALLELEHMGTHTPEFDLAATAFTIVVGSVSFAGSLITFAKLQELMTSRPVVFPGLPIAFAGALLAAIALSALVVSGPEMWIGVVLGLLGLALGVLLVLPVGGADVPIVISLLNAFTGLTVAAGGYVLGNTVLLVAGTLVGASGTFLTLLMAKAMGRSVANILFGALKGGSTLGAGEASDRPVRSAGPEDVAIMLAYAERVIIVPGYGLAVAQAQHTLRELVDVLGEKGIQVDYAIHPVAGRMPGHMNVLLAEAQVPYEQLKEMDEINGDFKDADVVLVVGANDVVNPAAKTTPGAPIYGMPILNADEAKQVVFMKRSMRPGLRRHRERAALRAEHHAALRRRQGLDGQAAQRRQVGVAHRSATCTPQYGDSPVPDP